MSDCAGLVVVLNGAPRSGKSSIAAEIQKRFDGVWMNLGVDVARLMTPPAAQPGIGLRPGEESHPARPVVSVLYAALWESVAAHARLGLSVVVDVGMYDERIVADVRRRLDSLPVLWVGVRCPLEVIEQRSDGSRPPDGPARWQEAVHAHWRYDLELDTSRLTPAQCAAEIAARLATFRT